MTETIRVAWEKLVLSITAMMMGDRPPAGIL